MAEETVDKCIKVCKLKAGKSATKGLLLEGAHTWTPTMFIRLIQDFGLDHKVLHSLISESVCRILTVQFSLTCVCVTMHVTELLWMLCALGYVCSAELLRLCSSVGTRSIAI